MTATIPARGLIGRPVIWLLVLCTQLIACEQSSRPDPFHLMEGEAIYKAECASCHGAQLQGSAQQDNAAPALDDSGSSWQRSETELIDIIGKGTTARNALPPTHAFSDKLNPRQIANLLLFLRSHWSTTQPLRE